MANKVLLMILDGWGIGNHTKADAIYSTNPQFINNLTAAYPHAELRTDGENVGLPEGQMGNSEVGHLNIGAGRVVYQDLVKINRACRDNSILNNPEVVAAFEYAKANGVNVHFMGLTSDGGVHSSLDHLFKLCDISKHYGIENTYIHCFMDGRDTDPKSGKGFIEALENHLKGSAGTIASIIGRYYAMDRDKRWERVKVAYDQLVNGVGEPSSDMVEAMQKSYDEGVTDEFVKPIVAIDAEGQVIGSEYTVFGMQHGDGKILATHSPRAEQPSTYNACQKFAQLWTLVYVNDFSTSVGYIGYFYNILEWVSQEEAEEIMREGL